VSTEENKAVFRRYVEALNKQDLAGAFAFFAPDLVWHGTNVFPDMDLVRVKQFMTAFSRAFPDAHYVMEDVIAEGDKVVRRFTMRGTHQGEFMGIPPTGKQVRLTGIDITRIKAGKFVEGWTKTDDLGLMQQLGVIPQMAQGGA
jgi:steroid delta-isomerase-like uncharacterized protein